MQLNYSHLKILKLKIYSSFLSFWPRFCAHFTWWQDFATLTILVSSLFLNAKYPIFTFDFFEKNPELTKDPKWPPFAKY